jgi:hypothetical protein
MQQHLLDSLAHLPDLKILRLRMFRYVPSSLKLKPGLRYVKELEIDGRWYVLEKDRDRPVGYREI